jgi:hypothetical protein
MPWNMAQKCCTKGLTKSRTFLVFHGIFQGIIFIPSHTQNEHLWGQTFKL